MEILFLNMIQVLFLRLEFNLRWLNFTIFDILIKYANETSTGIEPYENGFYQIRFVFLFLLQGPFTTFRPFEKQDSQEIKNTEQWTQLKFSPDGKIISIATNGTNLHLIEAFQGLPLHRIKVNQNQRYFYFHIEVFHWIQDIENDRAESVQFCFSPDSSYLLCGMLTFGKLHIRFIFLKLLYSFRIRR